MVIWIESVLNFNLVYFLLVFWMTNEVWGFLLKYSISKSTEVPVFNIFKILSNESFEEILMLTNYYKNKSLMNFNK